MVKYGLCIIKCNTCGKGCKVATQIQRDRGWDHGIVHQVCEHGAMKINMYTRNSYFPWGDPDEIKFYAEFKPKDGTSTTFMEMSCTGTGNGDRIQEHGHATIEMHFSSNAFGDYFRNTLTATVVPVAVAVETLRETPSYYDTQQW